jgi:hypothetical protein
MPRKSKTLDELLEEKFPDHTMQELADMCALSQRGLWNLRRGRVKPHGPTLTVMSMALKIPREQLEAAIEASEE